MGYIIAMAGKGGTGKTTLAGLMVRYLLEKGKKPVLAVDADSNSNLNEVLGLTVDCTLGEARELMKKGGMPNMTKDIFMDMKVNQSLVEAEGYDLIAMGRPEGEGCYCAANNLLSECIQRLQENYPYMVIDNEAGMEHISRLTTKKIDLMVIVSDASRRGMQAARRIADLSDELNLEVKRKVLIVNQSKGESERQMAVEIMGDGVELAGMVPEDRTVYDYDMKGLPTVTLPADALSVKGAFAIFDSIVEK